MPRGTSSLFWSPQNNCLHAPAHLKTPLAASCAADAAECGRGRQKAHCISNNNNSNNSKQKRLCWRDYCVFSVTLPTSHPSRLRENFGDQSRQLLRMIFLGRDEGQEGKYSKTTGWVALCNLSQAYPFPRFSLLAIAGRI